MKSVIGIDHRSAHRTRGLGGQKRRQRADLFDTHQFAGRRACANLIHQHIEPEAGRRMPSAARITAGFIETLEGSMLASPGDFIIRGVANEFYPCKPDIFAATYEAAE